MNPTPIAHRGCFPPTWKKHRLLLAGEAFRSTDRVLRGDGRFSYQMGREHIGFKVRSKNEAGAYPEGWYYRKVS